MSLLKILEQPDDGAPPAPSPEGRCFFWEKLLARAGRIMFGHQPLGAPRVTSEVGLGEDSKHNRDQKKQTKTKTNKGRTGKGLSYTAGSAGGPEPSGTPRATSTKEGL